MELLSAVFASALVFISVLVQHINNVHGKGVGYVLSSRAEPPPTSAFTGRATRTLQNCIESCAMYAPVALAVVVLHKESHLTYYAAMIYIVVRTIFVFSYWFGVIGLRSTAWSVGMICAAVMMAGILF